MNIEFTDSSDTIVPGEDSALQTLHFAVPGKPVALQRPRFVKSRGVVYDPSKKDKILWMQKIQHLLPAKPLSKPITVTIHFYCKRPKSHYRTGKYAGLLKPSAPKYNTSYPDLDNLVKFVLDAMNKKVYIDDKQIHEIICNKIYAEEGKTVVTLTETD